jgi:hypothetical protein
VSRGPIVRRLEGVTVGRKRTSLTFLEFSSPNLVPAEFFYDPIGEPLTMRIIMITNELVELWVKKCLFIECACEGFYCCWPSNLGKKVL